MALTERKIVNMVEMSQALLFQKHVIKHYWGGAVLPAVHLTNRLVTRILCDKNSLVLTYIKTQQYRGYFVALLMFTYIIQIQVNLTLDLLRVYLLYTEGLSLLSSSITEILFHLM